MHLVWCSFHNLSIDSSMSVPWLLTVTLLDYCIKNYRIPILMQYCFALLWHIDAMIRHTICRCCLCMFSCVSWPRPVLICTPLQTSCLIFLWCSHLCQNWYWALASRKMCLLWPCLFWTEFSMPWKHRCLDQFYSLCDWQKTQPLSRYTMIPLLITCKRNNPLLYYLCVLSLDYTFLGLFCFPRHNLHGHLGGFHNDRSFLSCCCYRSSSVGICCQFGLYRLNVDLHWLANWAFGVDLLYLIHVI